MTRSDRLIVIAVCLALATVTSAVSSINIALVDIAKATDATATQLQWIVDAYALAFAGLVLPAGALADRFGRRRTLLLGLTVFGIGAAIAMTLNRPDQLIAARVVMGIGGALTMPPTLSIITTTFTADRRDQAVSIWTAVAGASALVGVLASGLLLQVFSWQSVFGLNVVLAVTSFAMTLRFVPTGGHETVRLDLFGALLSALGLAGVVWGFIEGPNLGWTSPSVLAGFILGSLLIVAFVVWEARTPAPMLDPRLFTLRGFSAGAASVFAQFFAIYGVIFVALQYFQFVLRYSSLGAGLAFAPFAIGIGVAGGRAPMLVKRLGMRLVVPLGLALIAVGLALGGLTGATKVSYLELLPWILLLGAGFGIAGAPATGLIIASLPHARQGVASAVNDTAREVGGALGIAVFGSILIAYAGRLNAGINANHFVDGYTTALYVGAGAVLLAAILIAARAPAMITLLISGGPRAGEKINLNDPATLGRQGADIILDDPELSRRHLALRPRADGLEIEDLGSLNGTYVRGVRISDRTIVRQGAPIRVGQTTMMVTLGAPDSASTKMRAVERPGPWAPSSPASVPAAGAAASAPNAAGTGTSVTLLLTSGPRAGHRIELARPVTIGRSGADVLIDDPELSRRHVRVGPVAGGVVVEDLGSSNGTYVRGNLITGTETAGDGDRIRVGNTTLRVELRGDPSATKLGRVLSPDEAAGSTGT